MDKTTLLGLALGFIAIFGGAVLDGTPLPSLISIPAFLIVIVGTIGATVLSNPVERVRRAPALIRCAFFERGQSGSDLIDIIVNLAMKARRDGVLSLESEAEEIDDLFLRRGIQLVVDGADDQVIRKVLETDMATTAERHRAGYAMFDMMGGFAPTLGILGAVMGLIHVLTEVNDPTKLAAGIAVAFVATLYGVGTANLIYFPLGNKLRSKSEDEQHLRSLMLQGVLAIQAGDNPRLVRDKLEIYLAPKDRGNSQASNGEAQASSTATAVEAV